MGGGGSLLVGIHEEGLEVGHGLVEAGEDDGALVAGVCNYFLVSGEKAGGGGGRWRELTDKGLRVRRVFCVADEDGVCREPLVRN